MPSAVSSQPIFEWSATLGFIGASTLNWENAEGNYHNRHTHLSDFVGQEVSPAAVPGSTQKFLSALSSLGELCMLHGAPATLMGAVRTLQTSGTGLHRGLRSGRSRMRAALGWLRRA